MTRERQALRQSALDGLATVLVGLPWMDVVQRARNALGQRIGCGPQGMYEVLESESTLELKDPEGDRALFTKREKVSYLQDNVIACQDQGGDGQVLLNYRCSPGVAVDRYRSGHKTHVLISRRRVRSKDDIDEFDIECSIRRRFLKRDGHWETVSTTRPGVCE